MECECRGDRNTTNVRKHNVIRNYEIVGLYNKCGYCGRIEWLKLNDALEIEMADANYECIRARVAAL